MHWLMEEEGLKFKQYPAENSNYALMHQQNTRAVIWLIIPLLRYLDVDNNFCIFYATIYMYVIQHNIEQVSPCLGS